MTWIQILKLFSNRPLSCRFERDPNQKALPGSSPELRKKKKKKDKPKEDAGEVAEEETPAELVEAVFTEEDRPPLGLDMDWRQPPEVIQVPRASADSTASLVLEYKKIQEYAAQIALVPECNFVFS